MSSIGTGYDLSVTTFSPDGRVFQVEYATKAVDNSGFDSTGILVCFVSLVSFNPSDMQSNGDALISVNRTVVGIKCKDGIVLVRLGSYFYTLFSFKVNGAPLYVLTGL